MAEQYPALSQELIDWIHAQHVFFVATAAPDGRINLSPKGMDSLRVTGPNSILWLNLTGSGNESAAHLLEANRLTIMWCAFEGPPRILRTYGSAEIVHPRDAEAWAECAGLITPPLGARQYFKVHVDMAQTSCGYAVPNMNYSGDRDVLTRWSEKRGEAGIEAYWAEQNQTSLDGKPTLILDGEV